MGEYMMESLPKDFEAACVDEDMEGMLGKSQFELLLDQRAVRDKFKLLGIQVAEANEIFYILDISGDGYVDVDEFVDGLSRIRGEAKSADLLYLICFTKRQTLRSKELVKWVRNMSTKVDVIQQRLNTRGRELTHEINER